VILLAATDRPERPSPLCCGAAASTIALPFAKPGVADRVAIIQPAARMPLSPDIDFKELSGGWMG
jgi:hypothetical protein